MNQLQYKHIGIVKDGTPLIRQSVLVELGANSDTIQRGFNRGTTRWQGTTIEDEMYLYFNTLTKSLQDKIRSNYGNPTAYIETYKQTIADKNLDSRILSLRESKIKTSIKDINFFGGLKKDNGVRVYTLEDCKGLATSCEWARLCNGVYSVKDARALGFVNKKELVENVIGALEVQGVKAPRITNYRKFNEWLNKFGERESEILRTGRWSLVHKNIGNDNRTVITNEAIDWLIDRRASHLKPSFAEITRMFNDGVWQELGCKDTLSESRVKQLLNEAQNKAIWYEARHGTKAFYNNIQGVSKRKRASYPDAKWTIDGTTIQLLYTDENGKLQKDWYYVVYVFDNHSEKILAAVIDRAERSDLVEDAIKTALSTTMHKPYEIESDNGKAMVAKHIKEVVKKFTHVYLQNAPYKSKGRRAEQLIGRVEGFIMRTFDNFKGGNITSPSLERKANPDFIKDALKKGNQLRFSDMNPIEQMKLVAGLWNNKKGIRDGLTPNERYEVENDKREHLSYEELVSLYMLKRPRPIMYKQGGIDVTYKGETLNYWVADDDGVNDIEFRKKWLGTKFDVYFDGHYTDMIYLYKDDTEVAIATLKPELIEAKADQNDGDAKYIRKRQDSEKSYVKELKKQREQIRESVQKSGYAELGVQHLMKDELNSAEMQGLLEELGLNEYLQPIGTEIETTVLATVEKVKKSKNQKSEKQRKYAEYADLDLLK